MTQYELLAQDNGLYVFKFCLPILIKEDRAEIKLKPKRIPRGRIGEETAYLFEIAKVPDIRKIIFCDYVYLSNALEKNQDITKLSESNFENVIEGIYNFIFPILQAIKKNEKFESRWIQSKGWIYK